MNAYSILVEIFLTYRLCIQTPMGLKTPVWETLSWRLGGTERTNDKNRELITHLQHNIFTEFWTNSLKRWRLADNLQKNSKYTGHKEIYSGMQVDANQTIKTDVINTNERRQRGRKVIFFCQRIIAWNFFTASNTGHWFDFYCNAVKTKSHVIMFPQRTSKGKTSLF